MDKIVHIDPKEITKLSIVSGNSVHRAKAIQEHGYIDKNGILGGDWDQPKTRFVETGWASADFRLYMDNKPSVYAWQGLYESIKTNGYIQDPKARYIEVGLSRTGEFILLDGRHRLVVAQALNIPVIPVKVCYIHPDYNFSNLSIIKDPIIPHFIYDMVALAWDKDINVYHHWDTINHRYQLVHKHLPLLQGRNVLEIGCNSGMMMWSIMKYANSLVELEKQEKYFKQCLITKKLLKQSSVLPVNQSLKEFANGDTTQVDALYASFVLYHLNNDEVALLKSKILPNCKVVIIPNRQKERPSEVNSFHLNRDVEIKRLLEECGFKVTVDTSFEKGYSVIVGQR